MDQIFQQVEIDFIGRVLSTIMMMLLPYVHSTNNIRMAVTITILSIVIIM